MRIEQYSVWWAALDPARGAEINKTRPCIVITPSEMNKNLQTVLIVPITNTQRDSYPTRIPININNISGWAVVDQIRAVDKIRLCDKSGYLSVKEIAGIKQAIKEMLID